MKLLKRKRKLDTSKPAVSLEVIIINDGVNVDLHTALGITEERFNELHQIMIKYNGSSGDKVTCLGEMSKHCKHANELAFVTYCMAVHWEKLSNPFASFLQSLGH